MGLASNRIGNPVLFLICSIAISLALISFSDKIVGTFLGQSLAFCSKSAMIFMGFNYYFNTMSARVWKKIPICNKFLYNWWVKTIVVIAGLILISYIWEEILNLWGHGCRSKKAYSFEKKIRGTVQKRG